MSEQNILNPTAASQMNPTYSIPHKDPQLMAGWQPRSGKPYSRYMLARGMEFQLHWDKVQYSTYESLLQWFHQYEQDFFSYFNFQRNRYFSGQFLAEPQLEEVGNNQFNISATFVEIPTLPMFQYPSTWGVTSVFVEERNGFGQDLVKLTGTWDHGDKNYALWSEQMDNTLGWEKVNCTVVANSVTDPNGGATADAVTFSVSGTTGQIRQHIVSPFPVAGRTFTFSGWIKVPAGTQTIHLLIGTQTFATTPLDVVVTATAVWQRFSVSGALPATVVSPSVLFYNPGAATTYHIWGSQFEFGSVATTYTQTTATAVTLIGPSSDPNLHGNGFSYFNVGTGTDTAEWAYVGYGFRVWSPKGPDMGFMSIFIDGVLNTTIDLYNATYIASAAVFTAQSLSLAQHRVKLSALNQKNAASINFVIAADAIEVMR